MLRNAGSRSSNCHVTRRRLGFFRRIQKSLTFAVPFGSCRSSLGPLLDTGKGYGLATAYTYGNRAREAESSLSARSSLSCVAVRPQKKRFLLSSSPTNLNQTAHESNSASAES